MELTLTNEKWRMLFVILRDLSAESGISTALGLWKFEQLSIFSDYIENLEKSFELDKQWKAEKEVRDRELAALNLECAQKDLNGQPIMHPRGGYTIKKIGDYQKGLLVLEESYKDLYIAESKKQEEIEDILQKEKTFNGFEPIGLSELPSKLDSDTVGMTLFYLLVKNDTQKDTTETKTETETETE